MSLVGFDSHKYEQDGPGKPCNQGQRPDYRPGNNPDYQESAGGDYRLPGVKAHQPVTLGQKQEQDAADYGEYVA